MIELRPARAEEAELLGAIGFSAWEAGRFAALDAGRVDRVALLGDFTGFCSREWDVITVAAEAGRPLGWGAIEDRANDVSDLWVAPSAQGRGIGGALLGALENAIALAGYGVARLSTHAGNVDAIRFYRRHGYVISAAVKEFSTSLGYEIDKVRFVKELTQEPADGGTQEDTP